MVETNLSDWEKFTLLLWKNFNVEWNNRVQLVLTIVAPALFFLLLVFLRVMIAVEVMPITRHDVINLDNAWASLVSNFTFRKEFMNSKNENFTYNNFIPRLIVSYAPNTFEAFNNIMNLTESFLGKSITVTSFTRCESMQEVVKTEYHIAGLCFDETLMYERPVDSNAIFGIYPNHLNYSLIYPSELRYYDDDHIGATWNTNVLYNCFEKNIERVLKLRRDKNNIAYVREGFVSLQHYVSMSYISLVSKRSISDLPNLWLRPFPNHQYSYDQLVVGNKILLPLIIVCGFTCPVIYLTTWMVYEKERHLKAIMKILGLHNWLQFSAWLVNGLTAMSICSILLVVILKVRWYNGYAILNKSYFVVLLIFLIFYNIVSVCFCFMISSFFNRTKTSTVLVSGILWYFSYLPYSIAVNNLEHQVVTVSQYIFSNTAMGLAFDLILDFEQNGHGLQWNTLFMTRPTRNERSIGEFILIFCVLSIVYTAVALYVEALNPGLYGVPKKWNFIFKRNKRAFGSRSLSSKSLAQVWEVAPENKNVIVEIKDLTKEYNDDVVVDEVTMNLYEDDITCLMGHNGCGKTTLISMIAGLIPSTRGTATINGFNIKTEQQFAHAGMGTCLRDRVLFRDLTVANQIAFFSRMKGMNGNDAEKEVQKYLGAMNLHDKRNLLTRNLSIGLRQHLAVCCALAGNSKVVFLDEADAGMDLSSRHLLWKMLKEEKKGRTILISTHSTDNTESTADRVAIMSGGELTCYGSTLFLKKIYGHGYRLESIKERHYFNKFLKSISNIKIMLLKPLKYSGSK